MIYRAGAAYGATTAFTYDGFDLRVPSEFCNEFMLDVVSRDATRYFGNWPVHIIKPIRTPGQIDYPDVRLTAHFTSQSIRKHMDLSSLIVIWFQDEQVPVPAEAAEIALRSLDWEALAVDYTL